MTGDTKFRILREEPLLQLLTKQQTPSVCSEIDKEPLLQNPDGLGKTMSLMHPKDQDRYRGRLQSPDPYMFNSTIWVRHDR